jgi:hypothetical protein
MSITVNNDWQWAGDEYRHAFATTSDPRVIVVIERDGEYGGGHIDGDVYAPAFYWDRQWGKIDGTAGSTFQDAESRRILDRMTEARDHFMDRRIRSGQWERWARIFHGTTLAQVSSSIDRDAQVVILNTPTWREHVGYTGDPFDPDILKGDVEEWTAALDGEVYGIGWGVLEGHVLADEDDEPEFEDYDVTIECRGFLGEDYAKREAAAFRDGSPDLPEMLDLEVEQ